MFFLAYLLPRFLDLFENLLVGGRSLNDDFLSLKSDLEGGNTCVVYPIGSQRSMTMADLTYRQSF